MTKKTISLHIVTHSPMKLIKIIEVVAVPRKGDVIKLISSGASVYFKVVGMAWSFDMSGVESHTVNLFVERADHG